MFWATLTAWLMCPLSYFIPLIFISKNCFLVCAMVVICYLRFSGSGLQKTGDQDKEEDVVWKYEDKTDCFGYHHNHHSHYHFICLPGIQMHLTCIRLPLPRGSYLRYIPLFMLAWSIFDVLTYQSVGVFLSRGKFKIWIQNEHDLKS